MMIGYVSVVGGQKLLQHDDDHGVPGPVRAVTKVQQVIIQL